MVLAHAVEGGMEGGAAGLAEKVMAGIGGGITNGTAGLIAKGAEKVMRLAKVAVAAMVIGAVLVTGGVVAAVVETATTRGAKCSRSPSESECGSNSKADDGDDPIDETPQNPDIVVRLR